jgi:hypothetical protein
MPRLLEPSFTVLALITRVVKSDPNNNNLVSFTKAQSESVKHPVVLNKFCNSLREIIKMLF